MKVVPVTLEHIFAFLLPLCSQLRTIHDKKQVHNWIEMNWAINRIYLTFFVCWANANFLFGYFFPSQLTIFDGLRIDFQFDSIGSFTLNFMRESIEKTMLWNGLIALNPHLQKRNALAFAMYNYIFIFIQTFQNIIYLYKNYVIRCRELRF